MQKKLRELKPLREKKEYYEAIENYLIKFFRTEIYIPLLKEMGVGKKRLSNSKEDLLQAIASGQIQYIGGHFEGQFNSTLSKELRNLGAEWDRKHGWWKIPHSQLPYEIWLAIGTARHRVQELAAKLGKKLDSFIPQDASEKLKLEKLFGVTLSKVDRDFEESVKSITVSEKFTAQQKKRISDEYTQNMQLYIQDFTKKEIVELRKKIQATAESSGRYESIIDDIRESYGVSQNKAKFLARQETSLMMTKFKQVRYEDAGVTRYKWRCVVGSPAHPVRPLHKKLDGQIFEWDNPPIVDEKGNRKNPGQDFGCRCVAIPIVEF